MNQAEGQALLSLFATVDAVFTEPDALAPDKAAITLGRIYRSYKRTRHVLALQSHIPLRQRDPRAEGERAGQDHRDKKP